MIVADNGGTYESPTPGMYNAVCYRVVDLGTHESEYLGQKNIKREVMISWEIDELMKDGRRFAISGFYTASLNEKAKLRAMLESWRGRAFNEDELKGFDLANVLGAPCMVNITLNDKGKVRVSSVSPLVKGMPKLEPTNIVENFDLNNFDQNAFNNLSDGIKKKITESPEYQQITQGHVVETHNSMGHDLNDEIPF